MKKTPKKPNMKDSTLRLHNALKARVLRLEKRVKALEDTHKNIENDEERWAVRAGAIVHE